MHADVQHPNRRNRFVEAGKNIVTCSVDGKESRLDAQNGDLFQQVFQGTL